MLCVVYHNFCKDKEDKLIFSQACSVCFPISGWKKPATGACGLPTLPLRTEGRRSACNQRGEKTLNLLVWMSINIQNLNGTPSPAWAFISDFLFPEWACQKACKYSPWIQTSTHVYEIALFFFLLLFQHLPPCSRVLMTAYLPHTTEDKNLKWSVLY